LKTKKDREPCQGYLGVLDIHRSVPRSVRRPWLSVRRCNDVPLGVCY